METTTTLTRVLNELLCFVLEMKIDVSCFYSNPVENSLDTILDECFSGTKMSNFVDHNLLPLPVSNLREGEIK